MIFKPDVLIVVQAVSTVMAMFAIVCRAAKMTADTPQPVRWQHAALFGGLAFSLALPAMQGKTVLVLAMLAWLTLASPRWRHGVPGGAAGGH